MDDVRTITAVAGFATVALAFVALIVTKGAYPSVEDTPEQAVDRVAGLSGVIGLLLYVSSFVGLVVFVAGFRALVAEAGAGWDVVGTAGALLTVAAVAISSAGLGLALTGAWRGPERGAERVREDSERFIFLNNTSALPTAFGALLLAVGALAADEPAGWTTVLGVLAAALHVGIFASVARRGPLAPTGVFVMVGPPSYYLWVLAVSVVLL